MVISETAHSLSANVTRGRGPGQEWRKQESTRRHTTIHCSSWLWLARNFLLLVWPPMMVCKLQGELFLPPTAFVRCFTTGIGKKITRVVCNHFWLVLFVLRQGLLSPYPWLSWNILCRPRWSRTQRSTCICLPSTRMKGVIRLCVGHHAWRYAVFWAWLSHPCGRTHLLWTRSLTQPGKAIILRDVLWLWHIVYAGIPRLWWVWGCFLSLALMNKVLWTSVSKVWLRHISICPQYLLPMYE